MALHIVQQDALCSASLPRRCLAASWFGGGGGGTSPGIVGGGGGGSSFVNTGLSMDLVVLQGIGRIPGVNERPPSRQNSFPVDLPVGLYRDLR